MINFVRQGQGPVLVLLHGFLSGSAYWQQQIAAFARHFTVIAADLPGFGASSHLSADNSIAAYSNTVLSVLDEQGVESFALLGHSMGGMIAQEIAIMHPQRLEKLVLYGTGPLGELPGRFEPIETTRQRIQEGFLPEALSRTVASWFLLGTQSPHYPAALALAEQASQQAALAGLQAMESWQSLSRLDAIRSETLVIWADQDASYPWSQAAALWQSVPNASLCVLPGAAHNLHLEQPGLFNTVVQRYLTE